MACRPSPVCSHAAGRANACRSVTELLAVPEVAALLAEGAAAAGCQHSSSSDGSDSSSSGNSSNSNSTGSSSVGSAGQQRKLVLVFGREVEGLLDHEVDACDYTLSIPIGRLQGGWSSCCGMPCASPHPCVVVGPAAYMSLATWTALYDMLLRLSTHPVMPTPPPQSR